MENIEKEVLKIIREKQDKGILTWHREKTYRDNVLNTSVGDWEIQIGERRSKAEKTDEWYLHLSLKGEESPESMIEQAPGKVFGVRDLFNYLNDEHRISLYQKFLGDSVDFSPESNS